MKKSKTQSKLDFARKRLALDIEKQEYVILKDMLKLRHQYHPLNIGANFVMDLLNDVDEKTGVDIDMDALDQEILGEKNAGKAKKAAAKTLFGALNVDSKQFKRFKSIGMNLLTIADAYIENFAQKLADKAAEVDLLLEEEEEEEKAKKTANTSQDDNKKGEPKTKQSDFDTPSDVIDHVKNDKDSSHDEQTNEDDPITEDDLKK